MRYPKYTFLTYGFYESEWWTKETTADEQCGSDDIAMVLQYSLAVVHFHRPSTRNAMFYYSCYDATFTLALALNRSIAGTKHVYILSYVKLTFSGFIFFVLF